jgi:membrane-bound lytic murein transglycosylase B
VATTVAALCHALPASADTSGQADQKVKAVLAQVQKIQRQVAAAEKAYDEALAGVGQTVNTAILDGEARDEIAAAAAAQQAQVDGRIRALYESGGPLALYATLIDAADPSTLAEQAVVVQHIVAADQITADGVSHLSTQAAATTAAAEQRAKARIATERSVASVAAKVVALLAQEQALLASTKAHAAAVRAAEVRAAEAALRAQSMAFSVITTDRIAAMRMLPAAPAYMAIYHRAAAAMCPGLSWTILAAIGQVESGHGRDTSTSYAGAVGPMQFLPATFAAYAVDGDHDGFADITNPTDAIFTAARYLCANGASAGPASLANAIFHYNHAGWYVQMVLALAKQYAAA